MQNLASSILDFHFSLPDSLEVPSGIEVIYPYHDNETRASIEAFYQKFYEDTHPRIVMFGINPGRFGAGVTGIPFTDPIRLELECGIKNDFEKKKELSSEFVYQFINAFGGAAMFYSKFYINSVCPLGFLKDGKNYNYYDDKELQEMVKPFIIKSIQQQLQICGNKKVAICIGEGKNFKYFEKLNKEEKFVDKILPVAHPRYVLQYKRRDLQNYLNSYLGALKTALTYT
ncbi:MAG: DUF4918 family protein [Saprospiraceae bacterium]